MKTQNTILDTAHLGDIIAHCYLVIIDLKTCVRFLSNICFLACAQKAERLSAKVPKPPVKIMRLLRAVMYSDLDRMTRTAILLQYYVNYRPRLRIKISCSPSEVDANEHMFAVKQYSCPQRQLSLQQMAQ